MTSSPVIELNTLQSDSDVAAARNRVIDELKSGAVIIAPLESAYVLMCDAFNQEAVQKIHEIRGDAPGTASQVLVGSHSTLSGIATGLTSELLELAQSFWPGLLTLMVKPNPALNWDLGDGGALSHFAVRVPEGEFIRSVISGVGPVAIASASLSGAPASQNLDQTPALSSEIGVYVDAGEITSGPVSTVVSQTPSGAVECTREGAISLNQLREVFPQIGSTDY